MEEYHNSNVLSSFNNYWVNLFNSTFESILGCLVLVSSFLVLSAEKNWWGGYFSWNSGVSHVPKFANMTYGHEFYTIMNIVRFGIVGASLSFFLIISFLDIIQMTGSFLYNINK